MRTLSIALLLASAATTSAIFAQPVQNKWESQHKGAHTGRAPAPSPPAAPSPAQQHVITRGSAQHPPRGEVRALPEVRRVPIERVQQQTVAPRAEHKPVAPSFERGAIEQTRRGADQHVAPHEHGRVVDHATRGPELERHRPPVVSRVPRAGTEPPPRIDRHPGNRPQWNRDWRNNHRYDWSQWRRSHRSIYHMRPYHDPYGWAYQLFTVGWRLWPHYYYTSSYWIDDPWMYRLPPAPPGTRWIRYYNDALLVDTWTGEVIDVVHDVFW